ASKMSCKKDRRVRKSPKE
ncbi:hypothetical protein A2U01_0061886, partial [Trifolium medium]|nr:hypothetical protein [Trifolium medium]